MQFALILLCVLGSLDVVVAFPQPASPALPQPARRHVRPGSAKRLGSDYPNPLIASRQVKADALRGPQRAKRACPSFLPNGNCACPGTEVYCSASASCVNLQTNMENCGTCGMHCPSGTACYEGSCSQCDPDGLSPDYCSGHCTNTQMDSVNCGTCGTRCPTGTTCSTGECVCETNHGYAVCNNVCVNTNTYLTDPNNCGVCGFECGAGTLSCTNGNCVCDTANGYVLCNDACVSTYFFTYSAFNCGSCGHECMYPTSGCLNSECVCPQGPPYQACEGDCVDTSSDNTNCGVCGTVCPSSSTCFDSACDCDYGYTLCHGVCYPDSDFATDALNCGQCGNECISGETCINSVCLTSYLIAFAYASTPTVPFCYLQYTGSYDGYYCGDIDLAVFFQPQTIDGGPQNIPLAASEDGPGHFGGQYYLAIDLSDEGDATMTPETDNFGEVFYDSDSSSPGSTPQHTVANEGDYYHETGLWYITPGPSGELSLTATWVETTGSYELSFWINPNEVGHYVRATANPDYIQSEFASQDIQQVVGIVVPQYL